MPAGFCVSALALVTVTFQADAGESTAGASNAQADLELLASQSVALWDVQLNVNAEVRVHGWALLSATTHTDGNGAPVRFLAYSLKLEHVVGGQSQIEGLLPIDAFSTAPCKPGPVTLMDFASNDDESLLVEISLALNGARNWGQVEVPEQLWIEGTVGSVLPKQE